MENKDAQQLSEQERQDLLKALKTRRASLPNTPAQRNERQEVGKEEYVQRLKLAHKRDLNALDDLRNTKIAKASRDWADIVGATFDKAHTELPQVKERVERLKTKQGLHKTSIIFHGSLLGRGKTWHAYAYLNELVHQGIVLPGQIFFGTESSRISKAANSGFNRNEEMEEMKHASHKVFFIDDVGLAYFFKTEQREEVWYELIDHIYTRRLTLILTTNLAFTAQGAGSLGRHLGERAFDRLRSLVGDDGAILLQGINQRETVFHQNEKTYNKDAR
jgi:DNA replication protein DnaC